MASVLIRKVLKTGVCPTCKEEIQNIYKKELSIFVCQNNSSHFNLEVTFHGGKKITASLNNVIVPEDELRDIEW